MRAGALAEELGYSAAWLSDHLAVQRGATYPPSAYIYEPLVAMGWVAAATSTIELGTSVLVLPMRRPLVMAKMLGSIDLLSGGRAIVGAAGGYIEREFPVRQADVRHLR
jgi:alkanesulfonate monooxygenase SsuD/methylene tetrahydromethanopterin reductase-like flavin-dependent oxidoreductase (luciferase family)